MMMNPAAKSKLTFSSLGSFPWYPIFFAFYAPLALLAHNLGQVEIRDGVRSLLVTMLLALALLFLLRLVSGDWNRAAASAAVIIILLVSYGHVYSTIKNHEISGVIIGRHRYLAGIWAVLAGPGLWWSFKRSHHILALRSSMNLAGIVLLLYPSFQILSYAWSSRGGEEQAAAPQMAQHEIRLPAGSTPPDVYYIILDGYGRSDVLWKDFEYDNSAFLGELKQMGFFVAECAQSNYSKTDLSLSSSLNLDHVTRLVDGATPANTDRLPLWKLIKNNQVKAVFESLGYTTVAFDTGYDFTEVESSDVYFSAPRKGFNGFENLYLRTTLAAVLDDFNLLQTMQLTPEDRKRELILSNLEELQNIPTSVKGPRFVFAHLVIPHQPFVFGPEGEAFVVPEREFKGQSYYPPKDYVLGYRNQTAFISRRILEVIRVIMAESPQPPVILLQGDHGPSHFEEPDRMAILNAYHFPGRDSEFHPALTPVNSFRLLFNTYFNADFDLLEDVSTYSEYPYAYQFEVVPNTCQAREE